MACHLRVLLYFPIHVHFLLHLYLVVPPCCLSCLIVFLWSLLCCVSNYIGHGSPCSTLQWCYYLCFPWCSMYTTAISTLGCCYPCYCFFWIAVIIYYIAIIPSVFLQVKPHHNCSWDKHLIYSNLMCKAVQPEQCILYSFSLYCVNHDMYNVAFRIREEQAHFQGHKYMDSTVCLVEMNLVF